MFRLKFQVKFL